VLLKNIFISVVSKFGLPDQAKKTKKKRSSNPVTKRKSQKEVKERNNRELLLKTMQSRHPLSGRMAEMNHGMSLSPPTGMPTGARVTTLVSPLNLMKMDHGGKLTSAKLITSEKFPS